MPQSKPFVRKDAIGEATKGTLIVGGMGLMLSAIQNSLAKQNVGAFGVITRTGATIGIFGIYSPRGGAGGWRGGEARRKPARYRFILAAETREI